MANLVAIAYDDLDRAQTVMGSIGELVKEHSLMLGLRDRAAPADSATGLPLIVAITTIAVEEGHMRSDTAASLVGAGILSTAILPIVGLRLRAGAPKVDDPLQMQDETAAVAGA